LCLYKFILKDTIFTTRSFLLFELKKIGNMLKLKNVVLIFCVICITKTLNAQFGFSHELGAIAGPLQFRSDFGLRDEGETNFGNSGFGVGIVHYINFSYRADCNCYTTDNYFNDHFKLRSEISYNKTNLEHFGRFVDPSKTSVGAEQLRGHKGVSENLDVGMQIEFYPLSIRDFMGFAYTFSPFVSLGVHYTYYTPEVSTTFGDGDITNPNNFFSGWIPGSVDPSSGTTFSIVASMGVRYKLTKLSDLMLDFRFQSYNDDFVDGLNHQLSFNKNNDWLVWLNFGYIHYL